MARVKSVPTRSAFSSGPKTASRRPKLALITVSTVSASHTRCSTSAIASRHKACCNRLPTKPGTSFLTCTGIFPASLCSARSEEHTSELQSPCNLVCRLLLEKKKKKNMNVQPLKKKQKKNKT